MTRFFQPFSLLYLTFLPLPANYLNCWRISKFHNWNLKIWYESQSNSYPPQPTEAADEINEFVSNTTKGRIPFLVESQDLLNTKMVLANAAFFKGTWLYQFKKSNTRPGLFYSSPQEYTFVEMMTQKGNFRHGKLGNVLGFPWRYCYVAL